MQLEDRKWRHCWQLMSWLLWYASDPHHICIFALAPLPWGCHCLHPYQKQIQSNIQTASIVAAFIAKGQAATAPVASVDLHIMIQ